MYISIDTETGGFGVDKSLLTLSIVLLNENLQVVPYGTFDIGLIPDDRVYKVDPEALAVNKINLVELAKTALPYKEAKSVLYDYLLKHSNCGKVKLIPIGKQVTGDILKIQQCLISKNSWEQFVSYQVLDVSSIFRFLQLLKVYPKEMGGSLKELLAYYNLDSSNQHNALADAFYTVQVLEKMMEHVQVRNDLSRA